VKPTFIDLKLKHSKFSPVIFIALGCLGAIMVSMFYSDYLGMDSVIGPENKLAESTLFFKLYVLEIYFIVGLMLFWPSAGAIGKLIRYCLIPLIFVVYVLQNISYRLSGEYISLLVVENLNAANTIISSGSITTALSVTLVIFGFFYGLRQFARLVSRFLSPFVICALMCVIALGLFVADNNMGGDHKAKMRELSRGSVNGRNPPVVSMHELVRNYFSPVEYFDHIPFSYSDSLRARKFDLRIHANTAYPMLNQKYYEKPLPFTNSRPDARPNVIVFFAESLSARKLSVYDYGLRGVTPNLESFSEQALVVDNYYGHTQSTFRGIRGQLCSMFPFHSSREDQWADKNFEVPKTRYDCLPHHLEKNNYETVFMGPDHSTHMHFLSQTRSMGFKFNYYQEDINRVFPGDLKPHRKFLTDVQMGVALDGFLQQYNQDKPFFLTLYFKSGHLGLNILKDGVEYGDGSNRILNTIFTFDSVFGEFWNKFKRSPLYQNTIVIVTGDHSHWPEKVYTEMVGKDFNGTPIDKIGLIIYSPYHDLPSRYDARNATSLGFAPMVTQLVNIPQSPNSFIGVSPFERSRVKPSFSWFNERVYVINEDQSLDFYNIRKDKIPGVAGSAWKAVRETHQAEFEDRIKP
jgi:lipoteichoic acid synthase